MTTTSLEPQPDPAEGDPQRTDEAHNPIALDPPQRAIADPRLLPEDT
jgi:hypothetical protein